MFRYPMALAALMLLVTGAGAAAENLSNAPAGEPAASLQQPVWARPWTVRPPHVISNDRLAQRLREVEAARQQRDLELEAARKAREEERAAWLERWDEQRERARQASLERERHYREELSRRFPGLEAYRQRYARELEHRWEELEKRRQERWRQTDLATSEP